MLLLFAQWNETATPENIACNGGVNFLRQVIKEGSRFKDIELDAEMLGKLNNLFSDWSDENIGNS